MYSAAFAEALLAPDLAVARERCIQLGRQLAALVPVAEPAAVVEPFDWPGHDLPRAPREPRLGEKIRHPLADARVIADELAARLAPACLRVEVAGSVRRGKETVGDIELVYCSRGGEAETLIAGMVARGELVIRGGYGPKNKFLRHIPSGISVDLFAATEESWFNTLAFRTGPAASNIAVAEAARDKGWRWRPYGAGFTCGDTVIAARTEQAVFELVGIWCLPPAER